MTTHYRVMQADDGTFEIVMRDGETFSTVDAGIKNHDRAVAACARWQKREDAARAKREKP